MTSIAHFFAAIFAVVHNNFLAIDKVEDNGQLPWPRLVSMGIIPEF